ncbi:double-CXXCG motif protein [Cystobacter fuscus]
MGTARHHLQLVAPDTWWLLVQHKALEELHSAGLRHLTGCRAILQTRQKDLPDLFELELLPRGKLHPDCLPAKRAPACPRCGRTGLSLPDELLLDGGTLPQHLDLFRLEDFSSVMVCTERFFSLCQRLGLDGVEFHPLPTR